MYNDLTIGFIATTSNENDKQKLRKWAKAFDDANVGLRLHKNTHVYHLSPTDHELVVSGHEWMYHL